MRKTFFEKAKEKFGDYFNLSRVDYKRSDQPVCIVCPKHGEFITTPSQFLQSKYGCPKCAIESRANKQRLTTDEFISKCKKLYGDRFSYDKINYVNADTKVIVTCRVHGDFSTRPADFLRGHHCPKCKGDKISNINKLSKRYSKEEFIEKSKLLYNELFDYSDVIYVNSRTKILIHSNLCNEDLLITPSRFLQGDFQKKYLGISSKQSKSLTSEIFIQRAKLIHGDRYDYSKVNYKNLNTKVEIICPKHGAFWQTPVNHLYNFQGCPRCMQSRGESIIENVLIDKKISYIRQFPLKINGKEYKIDFIWKHNDKTIFIEYNGIQHYSPVDIFGGEEAFNKQIERDGIIRSYCKENGITLLEFPYTIPFNKLSTAVKNNLKQATEDA